MEQLKLKDLYQACKMLMDMGKGEKTLVLSDDNEGNGFHGMFFALTEIDEDNVEGFSGLIYDNSEPDIHNIIVVG